MLGPRGQQSVQSAVRRERTVVVIFFPSPAANTCTAAMMPGSSTAGSRPEWREASLDLVRCVGKWLLLRRPGRATCDSFVPWFVERVHRTVLGELSTSTGTASGSPGADDNGEESAACTHIMAGVPLGADRESPADSVVTEPGVAHEERSGAADIADRGQGEDRRGVPTQRRQAASEAEKKVAQVQGGPAKRRKTGGSAGRASTKRGRREARAAKSLLVFDFLVFSLFFCFFDGHDDLRSAVILTKSGCRDGAAA